MATAYNPAVVTDGLVLCLDAGNPKSYPGSGTAWTDLSGRGNNGTLTNGPTYSSANGGSIVLDGTNDKVNLGNNSSITFEGTSPFTLEIFVKPTDNLATQPYPGLIIRNTWTPSRSGFYLYLAVQASPTQVAIGVERWASGSWVGGAAEALNKTQVFDKWCHIVCTYNSTLMQPYFNGARLGVGGNSTASIPSMSANVEVGTISDGNMLQGSVGCVKIYNRALSATEVAQNFNALRGRFGI